MAKVDPRVVARYEREDLRERDRLFSPGFGELTRLRTWELFDRLLPPPPAVILDVGGGPGIHAEHLASRGYEVRLFDPVPCHIDEARGRATAGLVTFSAREGEARDLPVGNEAADVVLLMGPIYHLTDAADRAAALAEARRVLRPGGRLLVEVISRFAWVLECAYEENLDDQARWLEFDANIETGMSNPPDRIPAGGFHAYFHRPDEARSEVASARFENVEAVSVESIGATLPDLARRLAEDRERVLRIIRLVEREPSLLGASPHILITATKPT